MAVSENNDFKSWQGRELSLERFGSGPLSVLILGGVHGDEPEGVLLASRLALALRTGEFQTSETLSVFVCPRANPDGCEANRRTNHRNVDLNRNLPTSDWQEAFTNVRYYPGSTPGSEPETKALIHIMETLRPIVIFSLHSYETPMINHNGECKELAHLMSEKNHLPPKGDIGYPTPGSLGTYAGFERGIPTITLEILRGQDETTTWNEQSEAFRCALENLSRSGGKVK